MRTLMGTPLLDVLSENEVVRMSDIQRLPGCSKSPSSCMVWLLLDKAGLWPIPKDRWILDLTYGIGQFYNTKYFRGTLIAGYDVRKLEWRRKPNWFKQAPAWAALHDLDRGTLPQPVWVVVVDPPFQECREKNNCRGILTEVGGRWFYRVHKGVGTPQQILESSAKLIKKLGVKLVVHFREEWVPPGYKALVSVWWKPSLPNASEDYKTWWGVLAYRG